MITAPHLRRSASAAKVLFVGTRIVTSQGPGEPTQSHSRVPHGKVASSLEGIAAFLGGYALLQMPPVDLAGRSSCALWDPRDDDAAPLTMLLTLPAGSA